MWWWPAETVASFSAMRSRISLTLVAHRARLVDEGGGDGFHRLLGVDRELVLEVGFLRLVVHVVLRVRGGHPDDPGALLQRVVHRRRVEPADRVVEHDRPQHLDLEAEIVVDQRRDRHRRVVVVLDQDGAHPGLVGGARHLEMVHLARVQRRPAVNVQVDGALHERVNPFGFDLHQCISSSWSRLGAGMWLRQTASRRGMSAKRRRRSAARPTSSAADICFAAQ